MVVMIPVTVVAAFVGFSSASDIASTGTLPATYVVIIGIGTVLVGLVGIAYMIGLSGLLYVDQRIRRERFDLQLAAIAQGGHP